jgi:hypothetical protein
MEKISIKELILKGKEYRKVITIEGFGEIEIKPLTEEQWATISAMVMRSAKTEFTPMLNKKGEIDKDKTRETIKFSIDVESINKSNFDKNILTCLYGIVEEGLTEQELKQLSPPGIIEKIANEIFKISGIGEEQLKELQFFR